MLFIVVLQLVHPFMHCLSTAQPQRQRGGWRRKPLDLVGGVSLKGKGNVLRSVLLDLSQPPPPPLVLIWVTRCCANGSGSLSCTACMSIKQRSVLKSPDIPSYWLKLSSYQAQEEAPCAVGHRRLTMALSKGVINYFKAHPPRHSYLGGRTKVLVKEFKKTMAWCVGRTFGLRAGIFTAHGICQAVGLG